MTDSPQREPDALDEAADADPQPMVGRATGELLEIHFRVHPQHHGWRLDHYIQLRVPRLSRNRIQQMIRSQTELGGAARRPASRVRGGEEIVLRRPAPVEPDVPRTFDVVYRDDDLLAIDKPSGLPIHATARYHKNTLVALLRERYGGSDPPARVPVPAHRLDRETSGLMLLGLTGPAAIALKKAFRERRVHKRYLAIVRGRPDDEAMIDLPLAPDTHSGIRVRMAIAPRGAGMPSLTRYRTLERRGDYALVEASPETGRQHQIRVHLAAVGCPVIGDKLYGQEPEVWLEFIETGWTAALAGLLLLPRHALHAAAVSFPHPASGREMALACPLPSDLQAFWDRAAPAAPAPIP
jgi:23S rRNA pseudouridine1911/1915/1917 synthase